MLYKIVFLLLLLIADLSAKKQVYTTIINKVSCAPTKKEAILNLNAILKKSMGIDASLLYSKNVYIRHKNSSKGYFCLEGVVTQKGMNLYVAQLKEERASLLDKISHVNASSTVEVEETYEKICSFNKEVEAVHKKSSVAIKPITVTKKSLARHNKQTKKREKPPLKHHKKVLRATFSVKGCKGKFTTDCKILFISSSNATGVKPTYQWNFGDGRRSKRKNPLHRYAKAGKYRVTFQITTGRKSSKLFSKTVRVLGSNKKVYVAKPKAEFSIKNRRFVAGEEITFLSLAKTKNSTDFSYKWNFSDGSSSHLCNPKHRFKTSGKYLIELEVSNTKGQKSRASHSIQVLHPAIVYGVKGRKFNRIVRKFGPPKKSIEEKGVLTCAYQYGDDWLIVKQNKVVCRVKGHGFKTNLMGNPKSCRWYEKNRPLALYYKQ